MSADLRAELMQVRRDYGELSRQNVVDAARPPEHPLHSRFDWDNAIAGEQWRLHQAGALIRSVRLTYREASETAPARSVRAFHAVPSSEGHVFDPVEEVVEDPFRRSLLLASMEREWKALYRRYQEFEEFLVLVRKDVGGAEPMAA